MDVAPFMIIVHRVSNPSSYLTWEVEFSSSQLSCRKDTHVVILTRRQLYIKELEIHVTVGLGSTRPALHYAACTAWLSGMCCAAQTPWPRINFAS